MVVPHVHAHDDLAASHAPTPHPLLGLQQPTARQSLCAVYHIKLPGRVKETTCQIVTAAVEHLIKSRIHQNFVII